MGEQVVTHAGRESVAWSGLTAGALDDAIDLARVLDVIPVAEASPKSASRCDALDRIAAAWVVAK